MTPPKRLEIGNKCVIQEEYGKRAATCRLCDKMIPKDVRRIVIRYYLDTPGTRLNGSKFSEHAKRFHPVCLANFIEGVDMRTDVCIDCHVPIPGRVTHFASNHRKVSWYLNSALCRDCASSARWKFCTVCETHVPIHFASQVIEYGTITQRWCCDRCSDNNDEILTVKARKRLRRIQ